jgi:hypothetical protein
MQTIISAAVEIAALDSERTFTMTLAKAQYGRDLTFGWWVSLNPDRL